MRRRILIVALTLGTIGGYASGFAHLRHARQHWLETHHGSSACSSACCEHGQDDGPKR